MFMMPTPPTTSEISATTSSKAAHQLRGGGQGLGDLGHVADVEVVGLAGPDAVPLAQQVGDLVDGLRDLLGGGRLDHDLVHVGEADRLRRVGRLGGRRAGIERRGAGVEVAQGVDLVAGARGGRALWLTLVRLVPLTRYLIVVQGASTMSSWSMPIMLAPLRLSTPMTRKETFWMRISLPIGDSPWNSSRLSVSPITQTLLRVADVAVGEHLALVQVLPVAHRQERRAWCR